MKTLGTTNILSGSFYKVADRSPETAVRPTDEPAPSLRPPASDEMASSLQPAAPRIWLEAKTNLPGYTFVPEPVSDAVKETLGTTNIVSGTFYEIAADGNQKSEPPSVLRLLTSDI